MMKKVNELFYKFDRVIFDFVDQVKESPQYLKLTEQISMIDEEWRTLLNQLVTFFLITAPLIITMFIIVWGMQLKSKINTKKQIIEIGKKIEGESQSISQVRGMIFSGPPIKTQPELNNLLKSKFSLQAIDFNNVSITGFESKDLSDKLVESQADLKFNNFTFTDFTRMLKLITVQSKIKVSSFSIKRAVDETLNGNLRITHYGVKN